MPRLHRMLRLLVCSLAIGALSGCFAPLKNLNVMQMGPPYQVMVYDQGQKVSERQLPPMSSEEQAIAEWLEANREGWKPSGANQPPGKVIKGDGFTLNFTDKMCYLYIPPDPTATPKGKRKPQTEPILLQKRLAPGDAVISGILNGG